VFVKHFRRGIEYFAPAFRTSGDGWDSVYDSKFILPQYSPKGYWSFLVGGGGYWGPDQLAARGFPTGLDQIGPGDETPPRLDDISITPLRVDTATGDQFVTFRAHVTDDFGIADPAEGNYRGQGIDGHLRLQGEPWEPGGPHIQGGMVRVSGNPRDGYYEGWVRIPAGSPAGRWEAGVTAHDMAGNGVGLGGDESVARGYPGWVEVTRG
jgi:hypothetical protein